MKAALRIGTRGSRLALAQAGWVQRQIEQARPDLTAELVAIRTSGDRFLDRPLSEIGGKGLFVKEIEEALLAGSIDCAVHSLKDLPAELAPGMVVAAVPRREDPRDFVLTRQEGGLGVLPPGALVYLLQQSRRLKLTPPAGLDHLARTLLPPQWLVQLQ